MKPKCFFLIVFIQFILSHSTTAQINIDSLKVAASNGTDTSRLNAIIKLVSAINYSDLNEAESWSYKMLEIAQRNQWYKYEAKAYIDLGIYSFEKGNYNKAIEHYNKALEISVLIQDTLLQARCYGNLGNAAMSLSNHEQSIAYFIKALQIFEVKNNKHGIATCNGAIGNLYFYISEYKKAEPYYEKAYALYQDLKYPFGEATALMNLGLIKKHENNHKEAILDLSNSAEIFKKLNSPKYQGQALSNMGNCYMELKEYAKAEKKYSEAKELFLKTDASEELSSMYSMIGNMYMEQKNFKKAVSEFSTALKYADSIQSISQKGLVFGRLHICYQKLGNYKEAYLAKLKHFETDSTLTRIEQLKEREKLLAGFETERKEKEILILNKESELQKIKISQQNKLMYSLLAGLILMGGLVFSFFSLYKLKQKSNQQLQQTNAEIMQQKEEIQAQRDEIESQRDEIERRNELIFQSLRYAKTIQTAIIPDEKLLQQIFPDAFVYLRPKDLVSGDFYWIEQRDSITFLAVIDCTGHGVPGAFMTMVAYNLFNQAFFEMENPSPSKVLQFVNTHFIRNYGKYQTDVLVEEGMELTLAAFDMQNNTMTYSGNGALLLQISDNNLNHFKTPKAQFGKESLQFEEFKIPYIKGDQFYFYTDGFQDQFGGPDKKKFKNLNFTQFLHEIATMPAKEKKILLNTRFEEFLGNNEQMDDILVIGLKV